MNAPRLQRVRVRRRGRRSGVALVELLIALGISAALLAATAFALDGALKAYHVNQEQSVLLQNTRLAMHRITATIRRCKLHAPDDTALRAEFATGKTVTGTGVVMFDDRDLLTGYRFDATNKTISLVVGDKSYPLIHGVQDFVVTLEPMQSANAVRTGAGWDLLRRATIQLTVRADEGTFSSTEARQQLTMTMSASVMPRRNTW